MCLNPFIDCVGAWVPTATREVRVWGVQTRKPRCEIPFIPICSPGCCEVRVRYGREEGIGIFQAAANCNEKCYLYLKCRCAPPLPKKIFCSESPETNFGIKIFALRVHDLRLTLLNGATKKHLENFR